MADKIDLSGARIRQARERMTPKMIQEDAAKKLGITRVTYINWEKALKVRVTLHEANKMARVFQVKLEDLVLQAEPEKVNTVAEQGINYGREFDKYDQIYKDLIVSKDRHIESMDQEIKRLLADKDKLWNLVNTLTEGFSSLKKA
jgi:DNA-binding XRE family transcriptional regulator